MPKNLLIVIMTVILLLLSSFAAYASLDLYIGDQLVKLPAPLIVDNSNILIPASVLKEYMAAQLKFSSDFKQITIEFPTVVISMQVGTIEALVNGEQQLLNAAPQFINGEIMVPLRFIVDVLEFRLEFSTALTGSNALIVHISDDLAQLVKAEGKSVTDSFSLPEFLEPPIFDDTYAHPILRNIEYIGGSRSQVFIDTKGYSAYKSSLLTNPDRLMIDLEGVKWGNIPEQELDDTIIRRIRSAQHDENTVRIVLDLNISTNYKINPRLDGGLNIFFNYLMGDVGYYRDENNVPRLWFTANEQPTFRVQSLPSPPRLILDFNNSTLVNGICDLKVDDPQIKQIRIRQFNSSTARIVLDLEEGASIVPAYVEAGDGRYEIILFEGTTEEYQALLEQEEPEPTEPVVIIPEADPADTAKPLYGRIIAVDPGHGGSDPGTIGEHLGVFEKDIVLEIGLKLGQLLTEAGALVVYTRMDDSYVSVFDRPKIADFANAELLVSIHANSYEGTEAKGVETLFNPLYLENFRLAQLIQSELISNLNACDRGVRPRTDLAVLNGAKIPAVLVEVGFVTDKEEETLLNTSEYQQQIAAALFSGIQLFFLTYR